MVELRRGAFITIEGVDGAGSSTQTRLLVSSLIESGYPAIYTKEPNPKGKVESVIRHFLREPYAAPELDALLFASDRVDHIEHFIKPWLNSRNIVVSDRYLESSVSYQTAQGLEEQWVLSINKYALAPDVTIILDIDPAISLKRKGAAPERFENIRFLSKVRKRFLERAKVMGYPVINANRPLKEVHKEILQIVFPLIKRISRKS
jgi:dTMP kinase